MDVKLNKLFTVGQGRVLEASQKISRDYTHLPQDIDMLTSNESFYTTYLT